MWDGGGCVGGRICRAVNCCSDINSQLHSLTSAAIKHVCIWASLSLSLSFFFNVLIFSLMRYAPCPLSLSPSTARESPPWTQRRAKNSRFWLVCPHSVVKVKSMYLLLPALHLSIFVLLTPLYVWKWVIKQEALFLSNLHNKLNPYLMARIDGLKITWTAP